MYKVRIRVDTLVLRSNSQKEINDYVIEHLFDPLEDCNKPKPSSCKLFELIEATAIVSKSKRNTDRVANHKKHLNKAHEHPSSQTTLPEQLCARHPAAEIVGSEARSISTFSDCHTCALFSGHLFEEASKPVTHGHCDQQSPDGLHTANSG